MSNEEDFEPIDYMEIRLKPFNEMSEDEKQVYTRTKKRLAKCEWDWERIHSWYKQTGESRMFRMWDTFGQTPHSELGKQGSSDV